MNRFLYQIKSSVDLIEPPCVGVCSNDYANARLRRTSRWHHSSVRALSGFITGTFLLIVSSAVLADPYQDAIDKAFPGFQIMSPQDIKLYKEEMDEKVFNNVKDRPGLATGKFNTDDILDFAALIRRPEKRTDQSGNARYDGYLVICYGLATGGFDCVSMSPSPRAYRLPFGWYLIKVSPGKHLCYSLRQIDTQKKQTDVEEKNMASITTKSDALGYFRTRGNGDMIYVYQKKTLYSMCAISD